MLSLRGADPQLAESLKRLLTQDFPRFELHVVVDNVNDPAWPIVQSMVERYDMLHLSPLNERLASCGLQCSSLAQAAKRVAADVEVIVTIDGDLMPHATWLRELVQPLLDPRVGASFGNRWFMPQRSNWGSLVRYLWNVAAVFQCRFSVSRGVVRFAIRRTAFDQIQLADCWSKSIVHDAPVKSLLNHLELQVRFVPSLMMVLRETCGLWFSRDFLKRQMTWTRLYHPHWSPILLHAAVTTAIWFVAAAMIVWGVVASHTTFAAYVAGGLGIYWLTMIALIALLEFAVRSVLRRRGKRSNWISWQTLVEARSRNSTHASRAFYCRARSHVSPPSGLARCNVHDPWASPNPARRRTSI